MRILDVQKGHETEDVAQGRKAIQLELDHPSRNVMLIRGDTPEVSKLADRIAVRTDPFPWRSAIWVKADEIFKPGQIEAWFGNDAAMFAVVFDFHDTPVQRLATTATLGEIEDAYLTAQGAQS